MRQLNDLKERQIEQKIREFYRNEKLIENANEDLVSPYPFQSLFYFWAEIQVGPLF